MHEKSIIEIACQAAIERYEYPAERETYIAAFLDSIIWCHEKFGSEGLSDRELRDLKVLSKALSWVRPEKPTTTERTE